MEDAPKPKPDDPTDTDVTPPTLEDFRKFLEESGAHDPNTFADACMDKVTVFQATQEMLTWEDKKLVFDREPVVGKWYFWTETWADALGPVDSEVMARKALEDYEP